MPDGFIPTAAAWGALAVLWASALATPACAHEPRLAEWRRRRRARRVLLAPRACLLLTGKTSACGPDRPVVPERQSTAEGPLAPHMTLPRSSPLHTARGAGVGRIRSPGCRAAGGFNSPHILSLKKL